MIMTSFNDVTTMVAHASGKGYIRKVCTQASRLLSGFLELNDFGQLLGGHQPPTSAVSVPLVE